jgi:hypothetical protein
MKEKIKLFLVRLLQTIWSNVKDYFKNEFPSLIKNLLLFIIALILFSIITPFGLLYKVILVFIDVRKIITAITRMLGKFFGSVAYGIDLIGNALNEDLFNTLLLKSDRTEPFGDIEETISSVLGKNKIKNNLTWLGRTISKFLNWVDDNHVIKYIKRCL